MPLPPPSIHLGTRPQETCWTCGRYVDRHSTVFLVPLESYEGHGVAVLCSSPCWRAWRGAEPWARRAVAAVACREDPRTLAHAQAVPLRVRILRAIPGMRVELGGGMADPFAVVMRVRFLGVRLGTWRVRG